MKLRPQQERALQSVHHWLQGSEQLFRLFGYAGTGKTTLAQYIAEGQNNVLFAAFTGKAAHVLHAKGCPSASTLHRLIYSPKSKSRERLRELKGKLVATPDDDDKTRRELELEIEQETENIRRPAWTLKLDSRLKYANLLIVDECSMVDKRMAEDILSFGKKVLVLGDPAQLPPVRGCGYFTNHKPDAMLTDIRRTECNEIIWMSKEIREQRTLPLGSYGASRVLSKIDPEDALAADQVLVGKNATRFKTNRRLRELNERGPEGPVEGDRLVCLRNDSETGLINGSIWYVNEVGDQDEESVIMTVRSELDDENTLDVDAHMHYFRGEQPDHWSVRDAQCFDYGYALTVHKAQGSEWDRVLLIDQSRVFNQDWWRWLYTGVTRAAKQVDIVR